MLHREFAWAERKVEEEFQNKLFAEQLIEFYSNGGSSDVQKALEGYNQEKKLFKESLNRIEVAVMALKLP